jgi:hypothetical protein
MRNGRMIMDGEFGGKRPGLFNALLTIYLKRKENYGKPRNTLS